VNLGANVVGVIGPRDAPAPVRQLAEAVGAEVAAAGAVLVCGGLGGVMSAACRGAKARDGTTVGILPGEDRTAANPWVDVAVATGLGEGRNLLIVHTADVLIAVGGGYGTLSEIAFARRLGRPVIGLRTWDATVADADDGPLVQAADDPVAAVAAALAALPAPPTG
jgi:uncharacterized protein (TIGR00725 family)